MKHLKQQIKFDLQDGVRINVSKNVLSSFWTNVAAHLWTNVRETALLQVCAEIRQ